MPTSEHQSIFDPDQYDLDVIGLTSNFERHQPQMHAHKKIQVLFVPSGCVHFQLDQMNCILPPQCVAWIPAGVVHGTTSLQVACSHSVYLSDHLVEIPPERVKIVKVTALLKALIERISNWPIDYPPHLQEKTLALFLEEFQSAVEVKTLLPLPTDRRLTNWIASIGEEKSIPPKLNRLGGNIAASEKTISRIFKKQTGMSYQEWRQRWLLLKAIELLVRSHSVADIAHHLEFSSDSAFICFFKKQTGSTPLQYVRGAAA